MFGNRPPALGCRPQAGALQPGCQREEAVQPPPTPPPPQQAAHLSRFVIASRGPRERWQEEKLFLRLGKRGSGGPEVDIPASTPPTLSGGCSVHCDVEEEPRDDSCANLIVLAVRKVRVNPGL